MPGTRAPTLPFPREAPHPACFPPGTPREQARGHPKCFLSRRPPKPGASLWAHGLTWKGPLGLMGTCACCHTLPLLPLRDQACVSRAPLFRDRTRRLREPVAGEKRG